MRRIVLRNWATHELALRAARIALSILEQEGVRALPVKGVLLAHQVYHDPVDRPIADVDVLVAPADFQRALRIAASSGWEMVWDTKVVGAVNFVVDEIPINVKSWFGPPGVSAAKLSTVLARA